MRRPNHLGVSADGKRSLLGVSVARSEAEVHWRAFLSSLEQRAAVAREIRSIFNCPDRLSAQARLKEVVAAHAKTTPKLAAWLEENLPEGFTAFAFPPDHQRRLRTSNPLERVNMEIKRRTRVVRVFANEASVLRLVSALLAETSDDWETGKIHLNMECQNPPAIGC